MKNQRAARPYKWLSVLIVGMTVVALAAATFAWYFVQNSLIDITGQSLALMAAQVASALDQGLYDHYAGIQVVAHASVFQEADHAAMVAFLNQIKATHHQYYLWLGVTNASGTIVAATDPATEGQDHSRSAWFQTVRNGERVHLNDVTPSEETGGTDTISFSVPIRGPQGEFIGALSAQLGLPLIEELHMQALRSSQVRLSPSSMVEYQFLTRSGEVFIDSDLAHKGRMNLKTLGIPSVRATESGLAGYVEEEHFRRHVSVVTGHASTHGYAGFPGFRWGILLRMDRSEVLAATKAGLWQVGIAGIFVWAPMFVLLLWSVRRLGVERVRASESESEARESEERFRKTFDDAPIGMAIMDRRYRFVKVNKTLCAMLEYTDRELTERTWADIARPHDAGDDVSPMERMFDGAGSPYLAERQCATKHGDYIWVRLTATAIPDRDGRVLHGLGMLEDVTARKQMETDLRFFKCLIDQTHEPVYWISPTEGFRFAYVNEATCRHYGYPAETLLRMSMPDWDPTYSHEACERFWEELKAKQSCTFETVHRRSTGEIVPVEVTANYVAFEGKEYGAGTIRNIAERKAVEERLQQSKLFMEQAQKVAQLGSWYWDIPNDRVTWSEQLYRLHGLTPEMFPKTYEGFLALIHADDRDAVRAAIVSAYRDGQPYDIEFKVLRPDGTMWWNHSRGEVICDGSGAPAAMIGIAQDITDRKRTEAELYQREQQLWQLLTEREQLAQDLHDNIIQRIYAVGLSLEECQQTLADASAACARRLKLALDELNAIIRAVRNYIGGMDAESPNALGLRLELARLIRATGHTRAPQFSLRLDPSAASRLTTQEARHILSIAQEALSNSLRHSGAKTGTVSLSMEHGCLRLEVEDDGIGFDATAAPASGNGLRNIAARARKLGARFHVVSARGRGTRIVLDFSKEQPHESAEN